MHSARNTFVQKRKVTRRVEIRKSILSRGSETENTHVIRVLADINSRLEHDTMS